MLTNITWLDLCLAGVGLYLVKQILTKKPPAPFPPGPKGLPLIGNIADMPSVKPWITFAEWGQKYGMCPSCASLNVLPLSFFPGDISHAEVLGQHIVVLNNVNVAIEMLDKKSSSYSDRPVLPMGGELVGWKNTLVLLPYGDRFREYRKNFARVIGSRAAMETYHPVEEMETHRFLQRVLAKPAELSKHVRHTAGAIILRISHGYEVKENQDPFVDLADRAVDQFSMSTASGAFMVDVMPACRFIASEQRKCCFIPLLTVAHVPDWFPGADFKIKANEWRATLEEMVLQPYQFVKDQMVCSNAILQKHTG